MWRVEVWIASHAFAVHAAAWIVAFWIAVVLYAAERGHLRFILGLGLGALLAHLGWGLLHLPESIENPAWLLEPGAATVLFVPLGVLLLAPWREALAPLPLALAAARAGCLPFDCCYEPGWRGALEIAALVSLHFVIRQRPATTAFAVCAGLGALRLLLEPMRAPTPPLALQPWMLASLWVVGGALIGARLQHA